MMKKFKVLILLFLLIPFSSFTQTLDSIYNKIVYMNLKYPTIVFSQVIIETDSLTSGYYLNNHNLFGMHQSGSRATVSREMQGKLKYYNSWEESLIDYALLQMAFYRTLTKEEYLSKLQRTYAEDSNYRNMVEEMEQKVLKYFKL